MTVRGAAGLYTAIRLPRRRRARAARAKGFVVHRLVQDFARRAYEREARGGRTAGGTRMDRRRVYGAIRTTREAGRFSTHSRRMRSQLRYVPTKRRSPSQRHGCSMRLGAYLGEVGTARAVSTRRPRG